MEHNLQRSMSRFWFDMEQNPSTMKDLAVNWVLFAESEEEEAFTNTALCLPTREQAFSYCPRMT